MPKTKPFDEHISQYEAWFEQHYFVYQSELSAIRQMLPAEGKGIEIGIGSGRFAAPLRVPYGVEPSQKMIELATRKGLLVAQGVAEFLPVRNQQFDFALMVTTICFLDDVHKALQEAHRILKPDGCIVIGFVDKESPVGRIYQKNKAKNVFYRDATFYSVDEVLNYLKNAHFHQFVFYQIIFKPLNQIHKIESVKPGYGEGSFVIIQGSKNRSKRRKYE